MTLNEKQTSLLLSAAVFAEIAVVAYAARVVVTVSLGCLYVLPLALRGL